MKTSKLLGIAFIGTLLLSSCYQPDVVMHTTINRNPWQPCEREITYSNVMSQQMRDSLWGKENILWSQPLPECLNTDAFASTHTEIGKDDTVSTTFSIPFKTIEEMSQQTPLQLNGTHLRSKASLKKQFRWFYTNYVFSETFYCVGDTFQLADTLYADKALVSYWFTGEPNLVKGLSGAEASQKLSEIEPAINRWLNDNLIKVGFDFIVSHYDSIPAPPVSKERFIELHDSLVQFIMAGADDFLDIRPEGRLQAFFHSDAYNSFFDDETTLGKGLTDELSKQLNIFWFNVPYTLTMPGKVIDAGNGTLQPDGSILYPFTGERLIPKDYTITATSRVTHLWAYIVTLFIILIALGSMLYRRKRNMS
ncbi:MAG: hypothetical protein J6T78_07865 [Bacteroidaceae bacterium]|nr:hypothetical protein [Bacteroidaceae bacterium]